MAEKTVLQLNSHISFSAGKIALQSYFRKREMREKGVDGAEGGGGERRGGQFYYKAIS